MTTNNLTTITSPTDETGELRISSVKITKLASGFDQIEVKAYNSDVTEAARLARETYNFLWSTGDFMMPIPKEGTDKSR